MSRKTTKLRSPFLKRVASLQLDAAMKGYPFDLPIVRGERVNIEFETPVTIIVGENGSGKSTILEGLAAACGFNHEGGNANHRFGMNAEPRLARHLRLSWLPKISRGFFMRAESFYNFASHIDELARDDAAAHGPYGGQSLHARSHGESFLALFENKFGGDAIYILDEPEAAPSPMRQMQMLAIMRGIEDNNGQIVMATHSPILMAYPGATLLEITGSGFAPITLRDTTHFLLMRQFVKDPDSFVRDLLRG